MENTVSTEIEEDEVICKCFQVTESKIRSYIDENNVTEIEDVTSACEAGGNCASCHILIQLFIDQNKHKKDLEQKHSLNGKANSTNHKKGFWGKIFTRS